MLVTRIELVLDKLEKEEEKKEKNIRILFLTKWLYLIFFISI